MKIKHFIKSGGFSLVELLVVVAIMSVVSTGAAMLFLSGSQTWMANEGHIRLQENMRKVTQRAARELRQTSAVQIISADTIRFAIPIICGDPQRLICEQAENVAKTAVKFSVNYVPSSGQVGDLVEGGGQVVAWDFTGRSEEDPLIIYYDLGTTDSTGDTKYAIKAGSASAAPKRWRYEESDVYPGTSEDWTLLGGNSDDSISWETGELKIFNSGLGLKRYRRLVVEESKQTSLLQMQEFQIVNDELVWGAPLHWGCTQEECMEENYKIQYSLNDQ
ncbi:MAG TPA: prepilin-type N-terminal cleavage/methylation domain-containing protein, partial [Candidatus Bathyarchaeia archaeon]|nr:prepilin-type N-terminal cleavage/methylation domain-containing protein [Candidatus Bathyarchaeia archaeon]